MKVPPEPHMLEGQRNQPLGLVRGLGEVIDNSVAASASLITITLDSARRSVTIQDNGEGCSDLQVMFQQGKHRAHAGKRGTGRYGLGLKDFAVWLWGVTSVSSVHAGRTRKAAVNWQHLAKTTDWETGEDPVERATPDAASGTTIVFTQIQRSIPRNKEYDSLIEDLSYLFTPCLRRDVVITMRRDRTTAIRLKPFAAPPLEHVLDGTIEIEGRRARVHVGIVMGDIPNSRPGLHYTHRNRVIIRGSSFGCGAASTGRIFGWVELSESWALSKWKDDITDYKEELGHAVEQFIRPVLDLASQRSEIIELRDLAQELTEQMRQLLTPPEPEKKEKERRDPGTETGTNEPKGTERKRTPRKRQLGGELPAALDASKLRVDFEDMVATIGRVDVHGSRIVLAQNHPYVATLRLQGPVQRGPLLQLALALMFHAAVNETSEAQLKLAFTHTVRDIEKEAQFSALLGRFLGPEHA